MTNIIFPSMEALDSVGKTYKTGFTNGDIIVVNFYTGSLTEENVEAAVDLVITHELIHVADMNLSEESVLYATKIIFDSLEES